MGLIFRNKSLRALFSLVTLTLIFSSFKPYNGLYHTIDNYSFSRGEKLNYRVHLGFISAGEGTLEINDRIHHLNNRPCYKIDVYGKTTGIVDFFQRVRDHWGTYLDTASIVPHKFYQEIEEGDFRKHEIIEFDHFNDTAVVKRPDREEESVKYFKTPKQPQDLISGYYYIRTLDYTHVKDGELIKLKAFYDNTVYDFRVKFLGRETIKTKFGKIKSLVFAPIMPKNDVFEDGEETIKIWLSDDDNKIPLKVWAKMFVGAVEIDIQSAENLRSPLVVLNK
ncbi:MAG: DUF3108 domain-containing protein [Cyclobacteriaceae bacterium]